MQIISEGRSKEVLKIYSFSFKYLLHMRVYLYALEIYVNC